MASTEALVASGTRGARRTCKATLSTRAHTALCARADYLTKVVVSGKSSAVLSVEEIMTPESVLKTVMPGDTVLAAMELMIENNFRHVPVVRLPLTALDPTRLLV